MTYNEILIPEGYRYLFDRVNNFNDLPMDSGCGVACLEVIAATNKFTSKVKDLTPHQEIYIWEVAQQQCDIIING